MQSVAAALPHAYRAVRHRLLCLKIRKYLFLLIFLIPPQRVDLHSRNADTCPQRQMAT
jgi:hypothetical protein